MQWLDLSAREPFDFEEEWKRVLDVVIAGMEKPIAVVNRGTLLDMKKKARRPFLFHTDPMGL